MSRAIISTIFSEKTWKEFLLSYKTHFNHFEKIIAHDKEGTLVLCYNKDAKTICGIARLGLWENGHVWREHLLIDDDIHKEEDSKYNKYEIKISVFCQIRPISYDNFAKMLSADMKVTNTIFKGIPMNFRALKYDGSKEHPVIDRIILWIGTHI